MNTARVIRLRSPRTVVRLCLRRFWRFIRDNEMNGLEGVIF
jgi:hypothetical protein